MSEQRETSRGYIAAVGAYGLWGLLPVYFILLQPSGAVEIVAWRILLSLIFCLILLAATRTFALLTTLLRSRRVMALSMLTAFLIGINWHVYLWASLNGYIVEAALGYFINPLVSIALGVIFLREKLRPAQWVAVGISLAAVIVLTVGYGRLPWIALLLAFSFGFYGYVKNRMGKQVTAVAGLTLESAWLVPLAIAELVVVGLFFGGLTMGREGVPHAILLGLAGVVTAVPLLFFAAAARRLPLSVLGFFQYFAPILQFLFGVFIMLEPMPLERWIGFALVWLALVVLSADAVRQRRRTRSRPTGDESSLTGPVQTV
ncbi:chloramphenicol-sensitive protein RarD [Microcella putealis]|uniref:Chloramphenicol-sensitive protein RarD n=1 Tax=Microcella putealis TaxID=337005 RepID=A0A4Q7LQL2_9MICO|nr:EamA family transporter RarD [Microcella putealis]RZS56513.1 chloramphenicol-sensitive protein RarD [Microcella putealis]TQM27001.1 chloramphenicol-sensitive protein RarD [Microcella putealis]